MTGLSTQHQEEFEKGIEEFNRRQFYECHETLEKVWHEHDPPDRELIQGIIQVAVGYYHLLNDNATGALKLLRRGISRVEKFAPVHFDLDLTPFIANVSEDISCTEKNAHPPAVALQIPRIGFISSSQDC